MSNVGMWPVVEPHVEVQGEEVDDQEVLLSKTELKGDKIYISLHGPVLVCLVL